MTEGEFNTLEVGDVIKWFDIICEVINVRAHGCNITPTEIVFITKDGCFSIEHLRKQNGYDNFEHRQEFSSVWMNTDMTKIQIISKNSQKSLENKIKEKEIELETLKKELKEVNRKNIISSIIPGNVYKFTWNIGGSNVLYVREICEEKVYLVNLINDVYSNMYTNEIDNVEYLPELTETYKKLKDLLEKA